MRVVQLTRAQAAGVLKALQETTPVLDAGIKAADTTSDPGDIPHEPVIIIVD